MKTMKSIIILAFFIITLNDIYSQDIKRGDHIKNKKLDEFVGLWKGAANDSIFILIINKHILDIPRADLKTDILTGWYQLKVGNNLIHDNLDDSKNGKLEESDLVGGVTEKGTLILSFNAPKAYVGYNLRIKLLSGGKNAKMTIEYKKNPIDSRKSIPIEIPRHLNLKLER